MKARFKRNPCYLTNAVIKFMDEVIGMRELNKYKLERDILKDRIILSLHMYEKRKNRYDNSIYIKDITEDPNELPF